MTPDRPTLPPAPQTLTASAKAVADSILDTLVDRLPDASVAVDVLCYCAAHLTTRSGIDRELVVYRFNRYVSEGGGVL